MRICIIAHSHLLGGMERHVLSLLSTLSASGHTVCFAGPLDGWLGEQCKAQGIETFDLAMHGMFDVISALRLARFAKKWNADLLHGHSQRGTRYAVWAGHWSGRPAIATAHSTNAYRRFKGAERIICVANAVRNFLIGCGYPEEKLTLIYNGVHDFAASAPIRAVARAELGLSESQLVLGMVARFVKDKGHEVAVEALARLARPEAVLLLAGDDKNELGTKLRAQIASLGLTNQVRFLGERSDVQTVYAACDLLLAPSHREALSLTLIEAASIGLPSIVSQVGGNPEAIENGVNGLLFEPGDSAAMAVAITELAANPTQLAAMSVAAKTRFAQYFSLQHMCKAVEITYREVLDKSRG